MKTAAERAPMPDLTDFLLARIAEDEDRAGRFHEIDCNTIQQAYASGTPGGSYSLECTCRHTFRLIAECAAKRAIIQLHRPRTVNQADGPWQMCRTCSSGGLHRTPADWPCDTLLALAQPYADHPDFDPSWRLE